MRHSPTPPTDVATPPSLPLMLSFEVLHCHTLCLSPFLVCVVIHEHIGFVISLSLSLFLLSLSLSLFLSLSLSLSHTHTHTHSHSLPFSSSGARRSLSYHIQLKEWMCLFLVSCHISRLVSLVFFLLVCANFQRLQDVFYLCCLFLTSLCECSITMCIVTLFWMLLHRMLQRSNWRQANVQQQISASHCK